VAKESVPSAIVGSALIFATPIEMGISYGKAYMEAKLDFMKSGKFIRLEENVIDGD